MSEQLLHYVDRVGTLGKLEQTPQGGYRVPATITRTGVMVYDAAKLKRQGLPVTDEQLRKGVVRIHTPASVVEAALDTLRDAPVTDDHPPEFVNPKNFKLYSSGVVSAGTVAFDGKYSNGACVVQDEDLIESIRIGEKREVSAGYLAATSFEPGRTEDGEEYDAVRTRLQYNHVAIVARGRAGDQVCLALDSADIPREEDIVKLKIKGVEVDADKAQAAIDGLEAELAAACALQTKAAAEAKAAQDELALKTSTDAIDKLVADKIAADKAAADAAEAKAQKLARIAKAFPGESLEGKSDAFIDGLDFAAQRALAADPEGLGALKGTNQAPAADAADKPLRGRAKMIAEAAAAGRAPLQPERPAK